MEVSTVDQLSSFFARLHDNVDSATYPFVIRVVYLRRCEGPFQIISRISNSSCKNLRNAETWSRRRSSRKDKDEFSAHSCAFSVRRLSAREVTSSASTSIMPCGLSSYTFEG